MAVVINVLAVDPLGKGNFQMWPSDGSPGDSVINYGGPSLDINLINGIMVPICNRFRGPCPTDLMLRTNFAQSHAVVNVTGFFSPPQPTPLDCVTESDSVSVAGQTAFNVTASCPPGYTLVSSGYGLSPPGVDLVVESLIPGTVQAQCSGGNFSTQSGQVTCHARCCRIPGREGVLAVP